MTELVILRSALVRVPGARAVLRPTRVADVLPRLVVAGSELLLWVWVLLLVAVARDELSPFFG